MMKTNLVRLSLMGLLGLVSAVLTSTVQAETETSQPTKDQAMPMTHEQMPMTQEQMKAMHDSMMATPISGSTTTQPKTLGSLSKVAPAVVGKDPHHPDTP